MNKDLKKLKLESSHTEIAIYSNIINL